MQRKRIHLSIDPLGNPTIEAEGFVGESCTAVTAKLEEMLSQSSAPNERYLKPEWFQKDKETEKETNTW